jgi:hypothetical protein
MEEQITESDKASIERMSDFDGFEIEGQEELSKAGDDVQENAENLEQKKADARKVFSYNGKPIKL